MRVALSLWRARRTPTPRRHSFLSTSQDNDFLNHTGENMQGWGYAVFGKVTEGEDVLDKIRGVQTGKQGGHQDVPLEPIIIESVTVVSE